MTQASPKTILITGASRGLGCEAAKKFAGDDWHVVALARTQGGLEELDDSIKNETGKSATLIPFDLAQGDAGFAQLGENLYKRFGRLEALVLNAAVCGPLSPVAHIQEKDWNRIIAVNVTANMRLLRALDPMLRTAGNPHIVFITCEQTGRSNAYWGAYAASKKALEQLAVSVAEETKQAGFQVSLFDPGPMATRLRLDAFPGEDQSKLKRPEDAAEEILEKFGTRDSGLGIKKIA